MKQIIARWNCSTRRLGRREAQEQPGFRADWFNSEAPVLDLEAYKASPPSADTDLIVLPETWLTNVPRYLPGIPKVTNQNAFYSFGLSGVRQPPSTSTATAISRRL